MPGLLLFWGPLLRRTSAPLRRALCSHWGHVSLVPAGGMPPLAVSAHRDGIPADDVLAALAGADNLNDVGHRPRLARKSFSASATVLASST